MNPKGRWYEPTLLRNDFFFFSKKNEKKSWAWKPLLCSCYHSNVSLRNPSRSLGCKGPFRLLSHAYCSRNCNCSASVCIEEREQRKIFAWEIEITIVLRSKERVKYFRILAKFSRIPSLVYVISIAYCSIDFHTMQLFAIKAIISGFFWTI